MCLLILTADYHYILANSYMSHIKPRTVPHQAIHSSACSSEDYNRSSVKRLFSSVFSIIDNDRDQVSTFECADTADQILALLRDQPFLEQVNSKIRAERLFQGLPVLKVACMAVNTYQANASPCEPCQLDLEDLTRVFSKFEELRKVVVSSDGRQAFIFFGSFTNAFIAYKLLGNLLLRGDSVQMLMGWLNGSDMGGQMSGEIQDYMSTLSWSSVYPAAKESPYYQEDTTPKQSKLTCRFDIQIQNEKEFQVARRIIGSKGCNMKRIIEDSVNALRLLNDENKNCNHETINELLKLRLRGRGSGYKEGPQQMESNETLHLCVSAKDQNAYSIACWKVEKLLQDVYEQYLQFSGRQGKPVQLQVKKVVQSVHEEGRYAGYELEGKNETVRISAPKISELLELRNKARRQLNFLEADRIRNYLRSRGVCLIDEKGRRGKATDVTTWKYIF